MENKFWLFSLDTFQRQQIFLAVDKATSIFIIIINSLPSLIIFLLSLVVISFSASASLIYD